MTKTISPPRKPAIPKGYTMGRAAFGKVSAVEGIHLTPEMAKDFGEFDKQGLSPADRRKAIVRKYGRAS